MTLTLPPQTFAITDGTTETQINLSELNTGLILYFYPRDNTAGCSVQAIDFSAKKADFAKLGYRIIGVSRDSIKSHNNFIAKKELTIDLISDTDEVLCQHFDIIKEKNMYGKKVMGVVRSTFVFNAQGKLIKEMRNVRAKGHVERLYIELS